jgi:hypothetical protein
MTTPNSYRKTALQLRARALKAHDDASAAHLDSIAQCYFRLAEQAEQNSRVDVWAEFGPTPKVGGGQEGEAA